MEFIIQKDNNILKGFWEGKRGVIRVLTKNGIRVINDIYLIKKEILSCIEADFVCLVTGNDTYTFDKETNMLCSSKGIITNGKEELSKIIQQYFL